MWNLPWYSVLRKRGFPATSWRLIRALISARWFTQLNEFFCRNTNASFRRIFDEHYATRLNRMQPQRSIRNSAFEKRRENLLRAFLVMRQVRHGCLAQEKILHTAAGSVYTTNIFFLSRESWSWSSCCFKKWKTKWRMKKRTDRTLISMRPQAVISELTLRSQAVSGCKRSFEWPEKCAKNMREKKNKRMCTRPW